MTRGSIPDLAFELPLALTPTLLIGAEALNDAGDAKAQCPLSVQCFKPSSVLFRPFLQNRVICHLALYERVFFVSQHVVHQEPKPSDLAENSVLLMLLPGTIRSLRLSTSVFVCDGFHHPAHAHAPKSGARQHFPV